MAALPRDFQKSGDQVIEIQFRIEPRLTALLTNIEAATGAPLQPAATDKIAIRSADRVGMDAKPSRNLGRAGQTFSRLEVGTHDTEDKLCGQLLLYRNIAVLG